MQQAKERGKAVITGGPYATIWPQEVLAAGADVVVQGEAEGISKALLTAITEKAVGVVLKSEERPEMGLSPVPRYDLISFDDYMVMNIQTSRGCPYNCEFCDVIKLFGRTPRYKNPDQVLAELEVLLKLGWQGQVFISDDNFIGNKTHARAILDKLIPWMQNHGQPFAFWTQTSVNLGQDLELIDLLTAANFSTVFIGVESPEAEVLSKSGKHHNKADELQAWLRSINANGLDVVASFILGLDGEKPGADTRICQIVEACNLPFVMINILEALPGTDLWARLKKEGRLKPAPTVPDSSEFTLNFIPTRPEAQILAEWRSTIMQLYKPENYLARAFNYIMGMRPTRRFLAAQSHQPIPRSDSKKNLKRKQTIREPRAAFRFFWQQGVKAPYRRQFWRQLWDIYRRNPSRLRKNLVLCSLGEDGFILRKRVQSSFFLQRHQT